MPTVVSQNASAYNSETTPKTISVTVADGDLLVVMSRCEGTDTPNTTLPSGGGLTYVYEGGADGASNAVIRCFTAAVGTGQGGTFTLSVPRPINGTGLWWGFHYWVYSNHGGKGAFASTNTGSNTLAITTIAAGSDLAGGSADWNAVDGTTRTRRTVNGSTGTERHYFRDSARYTVYSQEYTDVGAAGSKTVGYSAPSGQKTSICALEIKAGSGTTTVTKSRAVTWNINANVTKSRAVTWAVSGTVVKSRAVTWNVREFVTKSRAATWLISGTVTKSRAVTWNLSAFVTKSRAVTWGIGGNVTKSRVVTWNINANVTKSRAVTWEIREGVIKSRAATWNVNAFVTKARSATWGVGGNITKARVVTWNINQFITKSRAAAWNIQNYVVKQLSVTWNISAYVVKSRSATWQIDSGLFVVTKSRTVTWMVDSDMTGSVADNEWVRLTGLGYTGSLSEMKRKWIADQIVLPNENISRTDLEKAYREGLGGTGSMEDMRDLQNEPGREI